jgi:hypothetical protein
MKFSVGERKLFFDENTFSLMVDDQDLQPDIRTYEQMQDLYGYKDTTLAKNFGLYFMYRGVYFSDADKQAFDKEHMRYDITILVSKSI